MMAVELSERDFSLLEQYLADIQRAAERILDVTEPEHVRGTPITRLGLEARFMRERAKELRKQGYDDCSRQFPHE